MVRTKDVVTEVAKVGCRFLGGLGAGLLVGTGLMGINVGYLSKPLKAIVTLGAVGLADAAGEISGKQLEKRVDEARSFYDLGEKFAENLNKAKEESNKEK